MKKYLLAGNLPYLAVVILCGVAFYAGHATVEQSGKFAMAEKSAVVLQAVLDRPEQSADTFTREVAQPIIAVLQRYADLGYTVLDSAKDEQGNYVLIAKPNNAIDITAELREAIQAAKPLHSIQKDSLGAVQ